MSGAGRGTPRANLVSGSPAKTSILTGDFFSFPLGPWSYVAAGTGIDPIALSSAYENIGTFAIPWGATRVGFHCSYLPAAPGGQMGLELRWRFGPTGSSQSTALLSPDLESAAYPGSADAYTAEVPVYGDAQVTPASNGTPGFVNSILTFWVPPTVPNSLQDDTTLSKAIRFDLMAREVSGSGGSLTFVRYVADNFAQVQPVARR